MTPESINYQNLPVQAEVIAGIVRLDVESATCFRDLDAYVHADQGVATLVLRVVNSALYSRGQPIGTIPRAISVLGFQVVRSLAMLAFSRSLFAGTQDALLRTHVWQHSLLAGLAGQAMAEGLGLAGARDELFVAGLMHDLGKVLLATHAPEPFRRALAATLAEGAGSVATERALLGLDHAAVGAEAVRQWRLPARFALYMGSDLAAPPAEFSADPVCRGLALANRLVGGFGLGAVAVSAEERAARLVAGGVAPALADAWADDVFLAALIANDTYQLCASL